jgi:hypothetical protein
LLDLCDLGWQALPHDHLRSLAQYQAACQAGPAQHCSRNSCQCCWQQQHWGLDR